jgi:hypothetical protein
MAMRLSGPNKGLELPASSVRSCLAPASGSSSGLAFGIRPALQRSHMKLLVLGGTLFIGRHIVQAVLNRWHDVWSAIIPLSPASVCTPMYATRV